MEATKRDMEEKKKEIVSHKEKEMSDMEQRFQVRLAVSHLLSPLSDSCVFPQQLRGDIRKKIENAVQINSELSEGIREGENKVCLYISSVCFVCVRLFCVSFHYLLVC